MWGTRNLHLEDHLLTWNLVVKLIDITSEQIFNIIQVSWTSWFRKHDPNALLGVYYFIWLIWGCSTGQGIVFCPPLSKTASRVLPRIYHVGEKSWVAEGDERLKGIRGLPPPPNENFWKTKTRSWFPTSTKEGRWVTKHFMRLLWAWPIYLLEVFAKLVSSDIFTLYSLNLSYRHEKLSGVVWTPIRSICDSVLQRSARCLFAPLQKSRRNQYSYVWTEKPCVVWFYRAGVLA